SVPENEPVAVGTVICLIETEAAVEEPAGAHGGDGRAAAPVPSAPAPAAPAPAPVAAGPPTMETPAPPAASTTSPAPVATMPAAPEVAPPLPTMPAPAPAPLPVAAQAPAPPPVAPVFTGPGDQLIPMTNMRRAIAEHMVRSVHTAPHSWTMVEVDMHRVVNYR